MHNTRQSSFARASRPGIALAAAGFSLSALAFQPLVTDDTGTQGAEGNQLEFAINADRATAGGSTERTRTLPGVYMRGLTESLDIFVGLSRIRIHSADANASGSGNPSVGAKWRFYENEASKTSFGLKPELFFPLNSAREGAGLGTGKVSGTMTLLLTQELSFGALHVNAGVGRQRYRDTRANPDTTSRRFSLAPVWDVAERWKLALDMGVESARGGNVTVRSRFLELGAIYSPSKDLDFAVGLVRATTSENPRLTTHTATAGITWRFK